MNKVLKPVSKMVFEALLPSCENCGNPSHRIFCAKCFEALRFKCGCASCGRGGLSSVVTICAGCSTKPWPWTSIEHLFWYQDGVETWLQDIKKNRRPERLSEVRDFFSTRPPAAADRIFVVSSDPGVLRRRLFSVAFELGRELSKYWSLSFGGCPFLRQEFLAPQKALSLEERKIYLRQLVRLSPAIRSRKFRKVILVDDVMTSGASLEVYAELLGPIAEEIHVYSLSRVESRKSGCRTMGPG